MCTLSLIAVGSGAGIRIGFSRDEQRSRAEAAVPSVHTIAGVAVVMPVDRQSGGTWIAAAESGLVAALMNVTPPDPVRPPASAPSRGGLIPSVIHLPSADAAAEAAAGQAGKFAGFRLVVADARGCCEVTWDGRDVRRQAYRYEESPMMWATSSLGDALVDRPRREWFDATVRQRVDAQAQAEFHNVHWPDRPERSVRMSRADARTVSITFVERTDGLLTMTYHPLSTAGPTPEPTVVTLPLIRGVTS